MKMIRYGYKLLVYKADKRTRTGERFVKEYPYEGYSGNAMMDMIKYLKRSIYKPADGWRLDFESFAEEINPTV
jgi:hypothetical protein